MTEDRRYLLGLREAYPHKCEPELELFCAASREMQKKTGLDAHTHRRRAMELLFPSRVWHDWRDQRIRSVQECLETKTQELMWIGSSNSNKTGDAADIALSLFLTRPEDTTVYIASPYETATETGVWSYIREQFQEAKDHWPTLPGTLKISDNSIVLYERNPRSFIRVTTVDQVGKLVGKKSRDFDVGMLVIILDELPAFTAAASRALFAVIPNLYSVPNLLILGTGNFANQWDALGTFCDPDERDIPGGYDAFNPDKHFRWRTKRGGLCLRFDGLQSPNVKLGEDKYTFLTTIAYIAKIAAGPGGLQSPAAMRFIRSAPVSSLDQMTVTTSEKIRAGGCYDKFVWTADPIVSLAYIDPGFGGDPCILQKFKLGWQETTGSRRHVVALWDPPFEIPIRIGLFDAETGNAISPEDQIVMAARVHCERHHIPPTNVGFDGSLRAGIVQSFARLWSLQVQAIDSNGTPTDRPVNAMERLEDKDGVAGRAITWRDRVDRLISEYWFAFASLVDSLQFKNLDLSPRAVKQLTERKWYWKGRNKRAIQTKEEYKADLRARNLAAESPNEADAVVGGVEMARRLGLSMEGVAPGGGAIVTLLDMIRERDMRHALDILHRRSELPSGVLHGIKPLPGTSSLHRGNLHR